MNDFLSKGGILLYPTDTLYGLGVDALNVEALKKLKELKGRSEKENKKPISIIVADMAMAEQYANVTPLAKQLAEKFLPGKLTLILNLTRKLPYGNFLVRSEYTLPEELTTGTGTIGIRIPNNVLCLNIVREFGRPITATSANVAGQKPQRSVPEILAQFGQSASMIDRVIDVGELVESLPSTVVDARGEAPIIVREGAIEAEDILNY